MASSPCELRKRIQISVCEEQLKTQTRIPWFNTIKGWHWVSNVAGWKFEPHTDSEISGDIIFYYWSREGYPPKEKRNMLKVPRIFGLHAEPGNLRWVLAAIPFILVLGVYLVIADARHAINTDDKIFPTFTQMADAIVRLATEEDKRTGQILLWADTIASLTRLLAGVGLAAIVGLVLGLNMAVFPGLRAMLAPFVTMLSIIPPLAMLSILFIAFGVGEEAKIVLIFIGTVFTITRDIYLATLAIPVEQTVKALTLGASELGVTYRVMLPQILPRLVGTVRLALGSAWLFLIAAEMIAATEGLGYRIGLVRRYMAMDIIIPYVAWITFLGFTLDWSLRIITGWLWPWYTGDNIKKKGG